MAASFEKTIQERPKPSTSARLQPTKSLSHFLSWGCPSSHQLARGKGAWSMTQASHEEVPAQLRCGFAPGGTLPGIPSIPRIGFPCRSSLRDIFWAGQLVPLINNLGAVNWSLPWNFLRCDGVAQNTSRYRGGKSFTMVWSNPVF